MRDNSEILKSLAEFLSACDFQLEKIDCSKNIQPVETSFAPDMNVELLTIKEALATVEGLSQYSLRLLLKQGKISYIRTGAGQRGKILINKKNLLQYFENS